MADKRDSSQQRRAKENKAARDALAARKEAARKAADAAADDDAGSPPATNRRTRAQADPVRGRGRGRPAASSAKPSGAAAEPDGPPPIPTEGPWLARISAVPGGRAVLLSLVLSVLSAVVVMFLPLKVPVERWDSRLVGKKIVQCVTSDGKAGKTAAGKAVPLSACAPLAKEPAAEAKGNHSDKSRLLATISTGLYKFLGPSAILYVIPPILIAGTVVLYALKPGRRRAWNWAALGYGLWMLLFGFRLPGPFFIVAFGALGYGVFKASRADPRRRRPGRLRRGDPPDEPGDRAGVDVVDISGTEVAESDEPDAGGSPSGEAGRNGRKA